MRTTFFRTLLLWMARNAWLGRRIPRMRFVRRAARRFMPGEDSEAALAAAESFQREGISTLFTRLGENVASAEEAEATADHYLRLLDVIAARGIQGEISVKLTQLGLDLDEELAFRLTGRLAESASRRGGVVWLDMEGSAYTARTITLYERLKSEHANTGLCLQAYLRRTAGDLARLLPSDPAIRLVKGAYDEPAAIAYRSRREVDSNYVALGVTMRSVSDSGPTMSRSSNRSPSTRRHLGCPCRRSRSRCSTGSASTSSDVSPPRAISSVTSSRTARPGIGGT